MAKYTVELGELIRNNTPLFDFTYPLYNASYKIKLEEKIINHYYFHEIGVETVARFKHNLKTKLNEIMPKYNLMYKAIAETQIKVLSNMKTETTESQTGQNTTDSNITVDRDVDINNQGTAETDQTNDSTNLELAKSIFEDTPQGRLSLEGDTAGFFATNITEDSSNTTINNTGKTSAVNENTTKQSEDTDTKENTVVKNTNNRTEGTTGYNGITEAELLKIYMDNMVDVDRLIIADLADLFMRIY